MSDGKVESLSGFVDRVGEIRKEWERPAHKDIWFRGESQKYRDGEKKTFLRPELYRTMVGPEGYCVDDVLKQTQELLNIESDLYEHFKRCAVQLSDKTTEDRYWEWDSYFLMQHHGAPTRLLDWSDGSQVALHFAVRRGSVEDCHDAIVYVLDPDKLKEIIELLPEYRSIEENWCRYINKHRSRIYDPDGSEYSYLPADHKERNELPVPKPPVVMDITHITRRIAAQRSRFLLFGTDPSWLADQLGKADFPIKEIVIDGKAKCHIRRELRDSGMTESVIFPDLDGLGREIRQIWEERKQPSPNNQT